MAVLESALAHAIEGRAQIVGVVAEAGTGKSRLCAELAERCRARGVPVREARGVAHGKLLPFQPLVELLRAIFGLREHDTASEARQKIAGALVLLDRRFDEVLPTVFELLGVPDPQRPAPVADPADRRRQIFAIIARLVRALGEREPSVVLLEDLHWFDDATVAFLDTLVEAIAGTKTILLVNFRPEFRASWMGRATYQQLPLLPLGDRAIGELLDDLCGTDASLRGLRELVRDRTGGNPFFVEEVVQSLVEAGSLEGSRGAYRLVRPMTALRVPSTVQSLLAARIDRLGDPERRVLDAAAVIGKRFPEAVLRRVVDGAHGVEQALTTLRSRDFVFEEVLFPETEYAFKHPLTQEVAYGTQLAERRRMTHAAVARVLEETQGGKEERAALLAHHWEAAGEALAAAAWHRRAAEWSERHSPSSAVGHWRALRGLASRIEDPAAAAVHRIAAAIGIVRVADYDVVERDEIDSEFGEGRRLAVEIGDFDAQVRILLAYSALVLEDGDFDRSAGLLAEAEEAAAATADPELKFVVRGHAAYARVMRGEQTKALELYDQAFALLGDVVPTDSFVLRRYLGAGTNRALIVGEAGRLDQAVREIKRLHDVAVKSHDLHYECITLWSLARLGIYRGEAAEVLRHAETALERTERLGALGFRVVSRLALGAGHLLAGNPAQALLVFEEAERLATPGSLTVNQRLQLLARRAEAHLAAGDGDAALAIAREAARSAEGVRRLGAADAFLSYARVLLAAGPAHERDSERALDAAEDVAGHCGAALYRAAILVERARLAEVRGDAAGAQAQFAEAIRLYGEMGATGHARRLARDLGLDVRQSA